MCVRILTFGLRGDVESLVGIAVWVRARGVPFDTVAAVAEGGAVLVPTGVLPTGGWQ